MPYKHIAAHLKKTELACRLHYHQLTHGSNRRKRALSCSSFASNDQSPIMPVTAPSSLRDSLSRSTSPTESLRSHSVSAPSLQLPRIIETEASRLPTILPKASMPLPHHTAAQSHYTTPVDRHPPQLLPSFHYSPPHHPPTPPLRLDCSALPPPSTSTHAPTHVDLSRLHAIYSAHRNSFWAVIAQEYGPEASPMALEQAWKTGMCCSRQNTSPVTPVSSPEHCNSQQSFVKPQDKTRISSILGIDADPRTARDRDMVRKIEEARFGGAPIAL